MIKISTHVPKAIRHVTLLLRLPALVGIFLTAVTVFFACHLTSTPDSDSTFTFPTLRDSIQTADSALIILKSSNGQIVDTLFNGPVTLLTRFENLDAPNYKGGKVLIFIEARKDGKLIYKTERGFDPAQGGDLDKEKVIYVSPSVAVHLDWNAPKLREGDEVPLPSVTVLPPQLADKAVQFISRTPGVLKVEGTSLKAGTPGSSRLVVWLASDTTRRDSVLVEVVAGPAKALDSLFLTPDTLTLALKGPSGRFQVRVVPASVSQEATWSLVDGSSVQVSPDGALMAINEGLSRVAAVSRLDASISDTAYVRVLSPFNVDSVRLDRASLELFVGGAAESLLVKVYPPLAPQGVAFETKDPTVVRLMSGKLEGMKEGETWVLVHSAEDPSKKDSLKVLVYPVEKVDSLRLKEDSLKLYVNGESRSLTASLYPATLKPRFVWRSAQTATAQVDASGKVSPGQEGKTFVTALALADSTRKDSALIVVKKDTPRLLVGGDTLIARGTSLAYSPEVIQEYGLVVLIKWDLNGDEVYEDSADSVPTNLSFVYNVAKEYAVRFYVKDTEGNDTTVIRKVKAVDGRVVQIISHKDGEVVRETPITVSWTVDGISHTNSQALNVGSNNVTRSEKDAAGNVFSHTITVNLDQSAPDRPRVKGPLVPVNTLTPQWTWASGGGGGNGTYRFRLDNSDLTLSPSTTDTFHTAATNLDGGTHTLFVQERDEAGNWSPSGSFALRIDTTAPRAPTVTVAPASPTRELRPTWNWTGEVGDAYRFYRYKLDNDDFRAGARDTIITSFRPSTDLTNGSHTLFVQERDSAGNWSATSSAPIVIDTERPAPPTVSVAAAVTNDSTPSWTWTTLTAGTVSFRYKLDNSDLSVGATLTSLKSFTPDTPLTEGPHTFYVEEIDAAGNWSNAGLKQVNIDFTPPRISIDSMASPMAVLRPRWSWTSYGEAGLKYLVDIDNPLLTGVVEQTEQAFIKNVDLGPGLHSVYLRAKDSAGNYSEIVRHSVHLISGGKIGSDLANSSSARNFEITEGGIGSGPYVSFIDNTNLDSRVSIQRLIGNGWAKVSPMIMPAHVSNLKIVVDKNDLALAAYVDSTGKLLRWMNFMGGIWYQTDTSLATVDSQVELAMIDRETPVLAISILNEFENRQFLHFRTINMRAPKELGPIADSIENNTKIFDLAVSVNDQVHVGLTFSALAFINGKWEGVGSYYGGGREFYSFSINPQGVPYVVHTPMEQKVFVKKCESDVCSNIGPSPIWQNSGRDPSIGFLKSGHPVVAFTDWNSGVLKVLGYDGQVWKRMTLDGASGYSTLCRKIVVTEDGVPHLLLKDQSGAVAAYQIGFRE